MEETETTEATTTTGTVEEAPNGTDSADLEKWKGYAKTWEKRAKERDREIKRLKDAQAEQADPEPEDPIKGELAALKAELDGMKAEKARADLVAKVAAEKGVPASLLHGEDEDALKASADAISAYVSQQVPGYPTDKGGAGKAKPMTREAIEKIADPVARVKARAENIELYK